MSRTSSAGPRRCYFCGGPGAMSKEHAWPQWMRVGADVLPTRVTTQIGFTRTAADVLSEAPNLRRDRQGSVLTIKVREVCRPCNNGWMSALETAARPVLESLWSGPPTRLSLSQTSTLSQWAVKTAWMHERALHQNPTATAEQRLALREGRPAGWTRTWMARHVGEIDFSCLVVRARTGHRDQAWDDSESRNVMLAVAVVRGLALLVRTDDGPGVPRLSLEDRAWLPLTPRVGRGRLSWPPKHVVSDDDIRRRMTYQGDWLQVPDLPHFARDTRGWLDRPPP